MGLVSCGAVDVVVAMSVGSGMVVSGGGGGGFVGGARLGVPGGGGGGGGGDGRLDGRHGRCVASTAHGSGGIDRQRDDGDFVGLPIDGPVHSAGDGIGDWLVAMDAVANADAAQRAVGNALPERLDIGGRRELQRGDAAAGLEAGGDHPSHHVAGIAAAVGVEHRGGTIPQSLHAHGVRRHVEFLGDQAEGRDEVAGAGAGGPHDFHRTFSAIDGGRRCDSARRDDRLPIGGKSICMGRRRRGMAPARVNELGHLIRLMRRLVGTCAIDLFELRLRST